MARSASPGNHVLRTGLWPTPGLAVIRFLESFSSAILATLFTPEVFGMMGIRSPDARGDPATRCCQAGFYRIHFDWMRCGQIMLPRAIPPVTGFLLFFFYALVGILTFSTDILVIDNEMISGVSSHQTARSKMYG